jgi:hypothetical protein
MNSRSLAALGALLLTASLAGSAAARVYSLSGNAEASIWNPAGAVRVEPASGASVEVDVNALGRDAGLLRITDEALNGKPTLRVIYPTRRIVYPAMGRWSNTSTGMRKDGTWGGMSNDWLRSNRVTIKGSGSGTEAWADLVVRVPRGGRVAVYTLAGSAEIRNIDGTLSFDGGSGGVTAEGTKGTLNVDIGSGAVRVAGHDGVLDIDTGSGSVETNNVRGASVHIDTGSGSVTGSSIATDDLSIDTGSGGVSLQSLDAKRGKIDTGSGGVTLGLLSRSADLVVDTGSGSVRVTLPPDFGARVHLETGSGGIRTDFPMTIDTKDDGVLKGAIGDGSGRLHVDTGSGGVSLLAANAGTAPPSRGTTKYKNR